MRLVFFILFSLLIQQVFAQRGKIATTTDTIIKNDSTIQKEHSPRKAALFSLIPGGGQVYNKKFWKIPVIYALGSTTIYFSIVNYNNFQLFRNTLISRVDSTSNNIDHFPLLTTSGVQSEMERYQKNFELMILATISVYALQIVDAVVDAHLMYFNVSDNLSLQVRPQILNLNTLALRKNEQLPTLGLNLKLNIR